MAIPKSVRIVRRPAASAEEPGYGEYAIIAGSVPASRYATATPQVSYWFRINDPACDAASRRLAEQWVAHQTPGHFIFSSSDYLRKHGILCLDAVDLLAAAQG